MNLPNGTIQTNQPIVLTVRRCWRCGRFWADEEPVVACGRCKANELNEAMLKILTLERRINALRGALTKARRGDR